MAIREGREESPPFTSYPAGLPALPVSVPSLSGLGNDALVNNSESILLHAEPLSEGIADDVFGVCSSLVPALFQVQRMR